MDVNWIYLALYGAIVHCFESSIEPSGYIKSEEYR